MPQRRIISEREVAALLATAKEKRLQHFESQVADWGLAWFLKSGERWLLLDRGRASNTMPVWPHRPYAEAFARETARPEYAPVPVKLGELFGEFGSTFGGRALEVFPTPVDQGVVVPASELISGLKQLRASLY